MRAGTKRQNSPVENSVLRGGLVRGVGAMAGGARVVLRS